MASHPKAKVVRRQITLPLDADLRLQRLARLRGQSPSSVVAEAIRALPGPDDQITDMMTFAGAITGGGQEPLGRIVDDVLYGRRTSPNS